MLQTEAKLIDRALHGASQELRLQTPDLAQQLQPGQPVLVRTGWGVDPYLRRTFYPIAFDDESWTLRLPPSGDRGHGWLRMAPLGTGLDCLGPIGRGFGLAHGTRHLLCLGDGERAWALLPVVGQAAAQGMSVTLGLESTTARGAIPAQRLPLSVEYRLATLDGSRGRKGRLDELLPELLRWADAVAAAGSLPFYHRLAAILQEHQVILQRGFTQVLYPATFLCGVGACLACVEDVAGGWRRVCLRGPVFDLIDIVR